ncbi:hypothetical protein ACFPER_09965 [Agromyces aurantiacus]|uniref:Uncharacterized protein n=1 Tax=Agromyces aurantiacus TaxID=165814 RepID=A0ABV9R6N1_9MICO|nr:hypothetical protein [Agromyces aurantiacus]MBM7503800.1 hypothetical protein [Agromyces aurantiacus]
MSRPPHPTTDRPRSAPRQSMPAAIASLCGLAVALAGCAVTASAGPSGGGVLPATATPTSPPPTDTPLPDPPGGDAARELDPRCAAQFPDTATILDETDLALRPPDWPAVPGWAVLCATEFENATTQVAWYATDPGISRAEVYRTYEHGMLEAGGIAGRAEIAEGEISTGVFPPDHSFWILATRDRYRITWSLDGQYAD